MKLFSRLSKSTSERFRSRSKSKEGDGSGSGSGSGGKEDNGQQGMFHTDIKKAYFYVCGKRGEEVMLHALGVLVAGGLGATKGGREDVVLLQRRRRVMPRVLFHSVTAMQQHHPKERRFNVSPLRYGANPFFGVCIAICASLLPSLPSPISSHPITPTRPHITQLLLLAMTSTPTLLRSYHQEYSRRGGGRDGRMTSHRPSQSWNRT